MRACQPPKSATVPTISLARSILLKVPDRPAGDAPCYEGEERECSLQGGGLSVNVQRDRAMTDLLRFRAKSLDKQSETRSTNRDGLQSAPLCGQPIASEFNGSGSHPSTPMSPCAHEGIGFARRWVQDGREKKEEGSG